MVSSSTEIANLALQKIGQPAITDIESTSGDRTVNLVARIYYQALDEILYERPWSFAAKRASLPRSVDTPAFEWAYQFPLPSDCVQVLECNGYSVHRYASEKFAVEGGFILSDSLTAKVRYVYRNTDPSTYPPSFVSAFTTLLAAQLCLAIPGNFQMRDGLMQQYERELRKAGMQNGNESRNHRTDWRLESDLVRARYGGGSVYSAEDAE